MADAVDRPTSSLPLRLHVLGGFSATRGGEPVPDASWQRSKDRLLVKLLAVEPGHRLHREQLMDTVWPEVGAADANFRNALHRARHTLEPELPPKANSSYLLQRGQVVTFSGLVTVDADQFEALARSALATHDVGSYEAALAVYGGELLPEDPYLERAAGRRTYLAGLHHRLLVSLAGILEQRGAYGAATERLEQALRADTTREEIHRSLMRLYAAMGHRHDALRQYQQCVTVMQDELDTRPEPETIALYERLLEEKGTATHEDREYQILLPREVSRTPPTPFIGREHAMELLVATVDRARAGSGSTVMLGGEAGMGKSRLAAEGAREAQRRGAVVLWGASHEQEGLVSYGPLVEALEGYLAHRPATEQRDLAKRHPTLARLLPTLALHVELTATPGPVQQNEDDRRRFFTAVTQFLADLARARTVLLVLDDLHLADTATLELLHTLARSAPEHRWLLIGTYREEDVAVGSGLSRLCAELVRERLGRRIYLLHLGRGECDRLVRALLGDQVIGPEVLDHVFDLSVGNPLFVHELIGSLRDRNVLYLRDGRWRLRPEAEMRVPRQVRELIEVRLQGLEDEDRQALGLAAVVGGNFTFAQLRAGWRELTGEERDGALLDRLDRGLGVGMLEERDNGYGFRHPLYRATLYERLSQHRRAAFHGAVAHSIEQTHPEDIEALAHHYRQAGDRDKAAVYLERAGDRAQMVYAGASAEVHFREALAVLDDAGHTRQGAYIRVKLGSALILLSRYDDALVVLEQAVDTYQGTSEREGLVRALGQIGLAHFHRGAAKEGLARLEPLLAQLDQEQRSADVATLNLALSHLYFASGRYAEQLTTSIRASELAGVTGQTATRAQAEIRRGTALLLLGDVTAGRKALEDAIPLAEAVGDLDGLSRTVNNLAYSHLISGHLQRHREYSEQALKVMKRVGDPVRIALYTASVGQACFFLGDWDRADRLIQQGITGLQELGPSWHAAYPLYFLGQLRFSQGNWEEARRLLSNSAAIARRSQDMQALRLAEMFLAEMDVFEGNAWAACERMAPLAGDTTALGQGSGDLDQLLMLCIFAWAEAEQGNADRAHELIETAVHRVSGGNVDLYRQAVLSTYGVVLAGHERWREAEEALDESLALAQTMRFPFQQADSPVWHAWLHARQGNQTRARQRLDQANRIFHRLGAKRFADRVALWMAGVRPER